MFSKILVGVIIFICFIALGCCVYGWLVLGRNEASYLAAVFAGILSTCFSFFEKKSERENLAKIQANPGYFRNEG